MITIDATDQILGKLAVQVANSLRGKNKPTFEKHKVTGESVTVVNAEKVRVTGRKLQDKMYYRHSGYLGHLKQESLGDLLARRPEEVLRRAVTGMLPKNKLRSVWLKNLTVKKGSANG
ncbi:50S ribosomal protein L13 [Candidatus Berkelbacteria bacterium]|nr:50S ribosomal protein L13 [Candidatus Berkelbacteria bacterium]